MRRATGGTETFVGDGLISIHALHEESDLSNQQTMQLADIFQSTLSMRRATRVKRQIERHAVISIHALHEESDTYDGHLNLTFFISIHALHEESDCSIIARMCVAILFQSTLSMRRATLHPFSHQSKEVFQSTLSMRRATE